MSRVLILAVSGVAIAGLAVTGWRALSSPPPLPPPAVAPIRHVQMVNLLVAYRDLAPGAFVRPNDLSTISVAADLVAPSAWKDTAASRAALVGALVRRAIPHDTLLEPAELLLAGDHGFLAALLSPGMRAFTIPHDQIVSGAELIWPGDHVDLILTQQMPTTASLGHQVSAETVLTDLPVLAIDRALVQPPSTDEKEGPSNSTIGTVTLEVSPSDAEKLAVALRLGRVAFAVRPANVVSTSRKLTTQTASTSPTSTTWADAVMHALDQAPSSPPSNSMHVFDGAGDKEYKF